jgi:integrase/recombinase XerC
MSIGFERAKKTFLGFLQARGKALNTIKNYACDLGELGVFCEEKGLDFQKLGLPELEAYHLALQERGLKPNSRRRKLMTAKTFLRYLSGRMDVSTVGSEKIVPPEKVEKPPKLVARAAVLGIARAQADTDIGWRNRALVGVLLDTGMLVTEALALKPEDCTYYEDRAVLSVGGKRARSVTVTAESAKALRALAERMQAAGRGHFFHGFSKAGPNPERMTSRGVEILFKTWAKAHDLKNLHPRTLRHLYVIHALLDGRGEDEIMRSLALRTPYPFRVYRPLIQEFLGTSTADQSLDTKSPSAP